ncbi:mechanosensitive ion channel protein MscS, partial [Mycobacterium sp. ITM-2017-0098]
TNPGALPRQRIEHRTDTDRDVPNNVAHLGRPQADSGLFSGNAAAERRGRALAGVRYDG